MADQNQEPQKRSNFDDRIDEIRARAAQEDAAAPTLDKQVWSSREMGKSRGKLIVRLLIALLVVITVVEIGYIRSEVPEPVVPSYPGGPPTPTMSARAAMEMRPTPTVSQGPEQAGSEIQAQKEFPAPPPAEAVEMPQELVGQELPNPPLE
jgi:hypothetical protein